MFHSYFFASEFFAAQYWQAYPHAGPSSVVNTLSFTAVGNATGPAVTMALGVDPYSAIGTVSPASADTLVQG